MKFTLIKISKELGLLIFLLSFILFCSVLNANNFDLTITSSTGYSITTTQDGVDNDIDFDMLNMDSATIIFNQTGNYHSIDIDVDGRTSDGSSITINQTGNSKSYSGNLYCGHTYCTMTLNQ